MAIPTNGSSEPSIDLPTPQEVRRMVRNAADACKERTHLDKKKGTFTPKICLFCDRIHTVDNPIRIRSIQEAIDLLGMWKSRHADFRGKVFDCLLNCYVHEEPLLQEFVVSPRSHVIQTESIDKAVYICSECDDTAREARRQRRKDKSQPDHCIWGGSMIGDPPAVLSCLNIAELALVSANRILTNTVILESNYSKGIYGYHSMFENDVCQNIANINYLIESGWKGEFVCVLCGPWETVHLKKVKEMFNVDPHKISRAFDWLREKNPYYKSIVIPDTQNAPKPRILHHSSFVDLGTDNVSVSNEVNIVVLFPEKDIDETNGVFNSQDEFRRFLLSNSGERSHFRFFTKPKSKRAKDFRPDDFIKAFPLHFPYGNGGFAGQEFFTHVFPPKQNRPFASKLRYYLRHSKNSFHEPLFNLATNGILMRQAAFEQVRLQCNLQLKDRGKLSYLYGEMSADELEKSIAQVRQDPLQQSASVSHRFLKSISAVSQCLPHSNEATMLNRLDYFSYLVRFGLPALFVTINPDDTNSLFLQVYLMKNPAKHVRCMYDGIKTVDHEDLVTVYRQRCCDANDFPGLASEEYMAVMEIFIRDLLKWNTEENKSEGIGLFGVTEAFTNATEEQMRKRLHGHFLVWIRGWNELLQRILLQKGFKKDRTRDLITLKRFANHVSNAKTFKNWSDIDPLRTGSIWSHNDCERPHNLKRKRFEVEPPSQSQMHEMRHNKKWKLHSGCLGKCKDCSKELFFRNIMESNLKSLTGTSDFRFDVQKVRLQQLVFEMGKDRDWTEGGPRSLASRLFFSNALYNTHNVSHADRCFKKCDICYANFPREPCEGTKVLISDKVSCWADYTGEKMDGRIFEVELERNLEDAYTNINNDHISRLFLCNNNVISCMTGASPLYVTGYNIKNTQKEERQAFEKVAKTIIELCRSQEENDEEDIVPNKRGFARLLLAVYTHTRSLVIAAPMAHYLALHGSRYRYSHERSYVPIRSISKILRGEDVPVKIAATVDRSSPQQSASPFFCRAMNYLYRSTDPDIENMSLYDFFLRFEFKDRSAIPKSQRANAIPFNDDHPKKGKLMCVETTKDFVLNIDWSFFKDAKKLSRPVLLPNGKNNNPRHGVLPYNAFDEEYCRRILILIKPFRADEDLKLRGSYQKMFQYLYSRGKTTKYEKVLRNIQNIRNSLDAGRMRDDLPCESIDPNMEDEDDEEESEEQVKLCNDMAALFAEFDESADDSNESSLFFNGYPDMHIFGAKEGPPTLRKHSTGAGTAIKYKKEVKKNPPARPKMTSRFIAEGMALNALIKTSFNMNQNQTFSTNADEATVRPTGTAESIIAFGLQRKLDLDQQTAYEILTSTVVLSFVDDSLERGTDMITARELEKEASKLRDLSQKKELKGKPLRMFLTGPAGAGKSAILDSLRDYVQEFCRSLGHFFSDEVIRLTALTGAAATEIKGATLHKTCKLSYKSTISNEDIKEWTNTRLLVIDEISFAGYEKVLTKLSKKLGQLSEAKEIPFGSIPIVFIGDFLQLEPIDSKDAIYKTECSFYWEQQLNVMVELHGKWRFKDCPVLQECFDTIRSCGITDYVREKFNSRCIENEGVVIPKTGSAKMATYKNDTKENKNNEAFIQHLSDYHSKNENDTIPLHTIVIMADIWWTHNRKKLSHKQRLRVCKETRESTTKRGKDNKRLDPMLKLYHGCEVMTIDNKDVANGIANGTTAKFEYAVVKDNANIFPIRVDGYYVNAVSIEDVISVRLQWTTDSTFQGSFSVDPEMFKCTTRLNNHKKEGPRYFDMKQLPLTINTATTGHKLQGKTLSQLVIAEWAPNQVKNWVYVVLSRVRKIEQLFLLKPIPDDADATPDEQLLQMMNRLREKLKLPEESQALKSIRRRLSDKLQALDAPAQP